MYVFKVISYAITHTFDFTGYAQRRAYWTWMACYIGVGILISLVEGLFTTAIYSDPMQAAMAESLGEPTTTSPSWASTAFWLIFLITNFSFLVRRLRDAGFGANDTYNTAIFYFFIPIVGQILLVKWLLTPSAASGNSWTLSQVEYQQLQRDGFTS